MRLSHVAKAMRDENRSRDPGSSFTKVSEGERREQKMLYRDKTVKDK